MNKGAGEARPRYPAVWRRRRLIGDPVALVDFSRVAAPLLAGFALSAVVAQATRSATDLYVWGQLSILAFAVAAGSLILAVQAGLIAAGYQTPPDVRLAWHPEVKADDVALESVRNQQWLEEAVANRHRTRLRLYYNTGVVALLLGLLAVLVPPPSEPWTWPRLVAVVVIGAITAAEAIGVTRIRFLGSDVIFPTLTDDEQGVQRELAKVPRISGSSLRWLLGVDSDTDRPHPDGSGSTAPPVPPDGPQASSRFAGYREQADRRRQQRSRESGREHHNGDERSDPPSRDGDL